MASGKFVYRLQKVLNMREKREDTLKLELADLKRLEQTEKSALEELQLREQLGQRNMDSQLAQGRSADLAMSNDYLTNLKDKIAAQEKKWKAAADKVAAHDEIYRKAQRDSEIIRKHKEKTRERWLVEERKLEAKLGDEMASNMFQAKQRRATAEKEEEDDFAARQAKAEQEAEAAQMLAESSWMQGFLATADVEAARIHAEWGRTS